MGALQAVLTGDRMACWSVAPMVAPLADTWVVRTAARSAESLEQCWDVTRVAMMAGHEADTRAGRTV